MVADAKEVEEDTIQIFEKLGEPYMVLYQLRSVKLPGGDFKATVV